MLLAERDVSPAGGEREQMEESKWWAEVLSPM
jgi:hypothetical protein